MTFPDDGRDEPGKDAPQGSDLPFDEDAAWKLIVDNYGPRADLGVSGSSEAVVEPADTADPAPGAVEPGPSSVAPDPTRPVETDRFDTGYLDAQQAASERAAAAWSEEGHFVPPEPPPVPRTTPARRLAWIGLFGAPVLMLLAVVADLSYPTWVSMGLVAAFVGGFVFLVATMERHDRDGWGGDDGAVV